MTTLKTAIGPAYSRLMSVAGRRGDRVVDNAEMCTMIDSSDEWIQQRTGIVERRWATDEQTPLSMALEAGQVAIERAALTDLTDRGTAFLFSDGAGAVVIGPSDEPAIGPTVWGSDGHQAEVITIKAWDHPEANLAPKIEMDGRTVFRWATTAIADKTKEALAAAGLEPGDLQVFIPHQANNRITDSMLRHLGLPEEVVVARDIVRMGNSSAASIPLAMEALLEDGSARSGDLALTIGFGAGLVYAGQAIRLP